MRKPDWANKYAMNKPPPGAKTAMKLNTPAQAVSGPIVQHLTNALDQHNLLARPSAEQMTCLVAVSGGSDSIAVLLCAAALLTIKVTAVTVDHGLRVEAAEEARAVANLCQTLSIPHTTLTWVHDAASNTKSASAARTARYDLLSRHAHSIGADVVLLGHTVDDLIETILMRAARQNPHSGTRGMAAMPSCFSYDDVLFIRPFLTMGRSALRQMLTEVSANWIDDPSNKDMTYERVRVRQTVSALDEGTRDHIQRFAQAASDHNQWLIDRMVEILPLHVSGDEQGFVIAHQNETGISLANQPRPILTELVSTLIWVAGGLPFRPSRAKFEDIVEAIIHATPLRKSVGRALVNVRRSDITIRREDRNIPPPPEDAETGALYDGRFRVQSNRMWEPYNSALERFRPCGHNELATLIASFTASLRPPDKARVHDTTRK